VTNPFEYEGHTGPFLNPHSERDVPEDRFIFRKIRPEWELVRIGVQVVNNTYIRFVSDLREFDRVLDQVTYGSDFDEKNDVVG
jgi:hypothetical protein